MNKYSSDRFRALFGLSLAALSVCVLGGCATAPAGSASSSSPALQALVSPANLAAATQDAVSAGVTLVLARNPSYQATLVASADALTGIAAANPGQLSTADLMAILSKTNLNQGDQGEIAAGVIAAQGIFLSAFKGVQLPTLAPIYQLFIDAVANGIYLATGHPTVPLPIISPPASPAST